jgi:hypothetical protein
MSLMGDTGNLATFTLTTQTAASALRVEKITIGANTLEMLDSSTLGTVDFQERIASDLQKTGDITIDFVFNQAATAVAITRLVDTATITFPIGPAQTTTNAATYVASGVVTAIKIPDLQNGVVMKGQIVFSPNGDTGPTYTRGS